MMDTLTSEKPHEAVRILVEDYAGEDELRENIGLKEFIEVQKSGIELVRNKSE